MSGYGLQANQIFAMPKLVLSDQLIYFQFFSPNSIVGIQSPVLFFKGTD